MVRSHPAPLTAAASSCETGTYRVAGGKRQRGYRDEPRQISQNKHGIGSVHRAEGPRSVPKTNQAHAHDRARHGKQDDEENVYALSQPAARSRPRVAEPHGDGDNGRCPYRREQQAVHHGTTGVSKHRDQRASAERLAEKDREREHEGNEEDGYRGHGGRSAPLIE